MLWEVCFENEGYFDVVYFTGSEDELSDYITGLCESGCHNIDYLLIAGESENE